MNLVQFFSLPGSAWHVKCTSSGRGAAAPPRSLFLAVQLVREHRQSDRAWPVTPVCWLPSGLAVVPYIHTYCILVLKPNWVANAAAR